MAQPHTFQQTQRMQTRSQRPAFAGAIIDAQGREVPITEQMIQRACRELEQSLGNLRRQA
jgi:hypothetical protein